MRKYAELPNELKPDNKPSLQRDQQTQSDRQDSGASHPQADQSSIQTMARADQKSAEPISKAGQPSTESRPERLNFSFSVPERKRCLERLEKFRYILDDPEIQKLKNIKRHGSTDTYKHSIRVAMIAAAMAERMGEDPDSAMRTGLLHDYCLLDYNLKGKEKREAKKAANAGLFCFYHPKKAAENAKRFGLTDRELEAIATHMFPLGPIPKSKLGWIIRMADMEAGSEETLLGKRKKDSQQKNSQQKDSQPEKS